VQRIGFVGTENSHTDHFIRFLNTEGRHSGYRAAALAGGRHERNEALAALGGIDLVVDDPAELIGNVDAAIISTRDGARHREQAIPLLTAGLPVMVDKPLATTVADAQATIAAAESGRVPLVSCSALRFAPEIAEFGARDEDGGGLRQVTVSGPADPASEYSGLFFYGIHHVEAALEVLGNPRVEPNSITATVTNHGDTTVALTRISEVDVVFTFIAPHGGHRTPFHITATSSDRVLARELTLGPDYNAPALDRFITAIETGRSPVDDHELLSPVVVLAAIVDALAATTSAG
jgi:predicted dehydrogenase